MVNVFDPTLGAYTTIALTGAINRMPRFYNKIGSMGIFRPTGVRKAVFAADELTEAVYMISSNAKNAPPAVGAFARRELRAMSTVHFPHTFTVRIDEIANRRAFGSEADQTAAAVIARKMFMERRKLDQTIEYLRLGAARGIVVDPDGTTLMNYFTHFGMPQDVVDFNLDNNSTNVGTKCRDVARLVEDNVLGDTVTGLVALCGSNFWESLVTHPSVQDWYKYVAQQQNLGLNDFRNLGFYFQGITFYEYRGRALGPDRSTMVNFINTNEAHIVPQGSGIFPEVYSPMNHIDFYDQPGQELYLSQEKLDHGQGWEFHMETNPLPICTNPKVLVKLVLT